MTLQWITTTSACQKLRFSTKSMLGILVRRTSIPLRYLQFSFVRHLMIHTVLMQSQLCWAGHVLCMPDHWFPKKLPFRELQHGKRSLGGQKKRFKNTLKVSLKAFNISYNSWEQAAMKRRKWRAAVCSGAESHEANRIAAAEQHRKDRKSSAFKSPTAATILCPYCTRTFRARIGLISHLCSLRDRFSQPQDD